MREPTARVPPQASQKIIANTILLCVGVALSLVWLQTIVGKYATQIFWRLTFRQDVAAAWLMLAVVVMAGLCLPLVGRTSFFDHTETIAQWVDKHIGRIALVSVPLYAALALLVARGHAFTSDEYTVLFQSEVFAAGHLHASVRPEFIDWIIPDEYQGHFLHVSHARGELVSSYWPGFALLLAPFTALGVPWLCNPVLTAISLWALHRATLALFDSRVAAAWAVLFFVTSPVIALNAATYYTMPAHQLANILYCWLLAGRTRRSALGAGLVGGFALWLHNPIPHALFAIPWMLWIASRQRRLLIPLLLGYLVCLPLGLFWSSLLATYDPSSDTVAAQAMVKQVSQGPLLEILARLQATLRFPSLALWLTRLAGLDKVVVWAVPGLPILAWAGWRLAKTDRFARLLVAALVLTFVAFMFVRFAQGGGWGFRYLHQVWFALAMLGGVFLARLPVTDASASSLNRYVGLCVAASFLLFLPLRLYQAETFLRGYRAQVPTPPRAGATISFIEVKRGFQTTALVQNDAFLRNTDWKLVDRGDANNSKFAHRVLVKPRLVNRGVWGQIWVGEAFNPHFRW